MIHKNSWHRDDLIYFAGFFDGEGCFNIRIHHPNKELNRSHYLCRMCINTTDKEVMSWIHNEFGGNLNLHYRETHYKPIYCWSFSGPPMTNFLKQLFPYLKTKKPQAEVMLKFRETFIPGRYPKDPLPEKFIQIRAECIQKLHFLNHRGSLPPCPLSPSSLR